MQHNQAMVMSAANGSTDRGLHGDPHMGGTGDARNAYGGPSAMSMGKFVILFLNISSIRLYVKVTL